MKQEMVHATAVAIDGQGILLTGPSGSGKSDLALRIIDRGGVLISDDVVIVSKADQGLSVGVAPNIAGKIEVRGVGICTVRHLSSAPLRLVVALSNAIDRIPEKQRTISMMGVDVPSIDLASLECSSAIKLEMALKHIVESRCAHAPTHHFNPSESRKA
jgi:HPr kinase/phosphorylase